MLWCNWWSAVSIILGCSIYRYHVFDWQLFYQNYSVTWYKCWYSRWLSLFVCSCFIRLVPDVDTRPFKVFLIVYYRCIFGVSFSNTKLRPFLLFGDCWCTMTLIFHDCMSWWATACHNFCCSTSVFVEHCYDETWYWQRDYLDVCDAFDCSGVFCSYYSAAETLFVPPVWWYKLFGMFFMLTIVHPFFVPVMPMIPYLRHERVAMVRYSDTWL